MRGQIAVDCPRGSLYDIKRDMTEDITPTPELTPQPQPSFAAPSTSPPQLPKKRRLWFWVGLGVVVVVLGMFIFNVVRVMYQINTKTTDSSKNTAPSAGATGAAYKLYDALGNAVAQQKLRVAMHRTTYANKADADAHQHKGSEQSSVAAMDTTIPVYANVFASSIGEGSGFTVGRCVNKAAYGNPDSDAAGIKTLAAAVERLKQPLGQIPKGQVGDSCSQYGLAPGAIVHLAWARLSDGIMPVTLERAQARDWAEKMKGTALFKVTDDGLTAKDGRQVRKYSFSPNIESDRIGVTLYEIFKQASHIEELQRQHPGTTYGYAYIPPSATLSSGAQGFYLIDETTNLPVYSEINSLAKDMAADGHAPSLLNLARTKFSYSYGAPVSIDMNTPLELLD